MAPPERLVSICADGLCMIYFFFGTSYERDATRRTYRDGIAKGEASMNRAYAIDRLRTWARQAQNEAQEADTREDILNWQGQAQVLGDVATFLAGPGAQIDHNAIWKQVLADRTRAIASWQRHQAAPRALLYSRIVAGYHLVVTTLSDITTRT